MSSTLDERTLERELREHTAAAQKAEGEKDVAMHAAEEWVAKTRAEGGDPVNDPKLFAEADAMYKVADTAAESASRHRQSADGLLSLLGRKVEADITRAAKRGGKRAVDMLFETPEYKRLAEVNAFSGPGARIEIPGVEIASADQVVASLKAGMPLFTATADVGDFVNIDQRRFPPIEIPRRQLRVLDLVTVSTTESDKIDYVEEVTRTDAAAETALGTAYSEATYAYEEREAIVRDIGHFTPAHRSNLADAGQVQGLLEGRLQYGVERRLEDQIVAGNGVGQNLLGILNTDNIGHIERNATTSENKLDVIHRGITAIRLSLFGEPDAVGMDPTSYHEIVTLKADDSGVYLLGQASGQTSKTVWGFDTVVTTAFPSETALVGNYKAGAIAWIRAGVSVRASDSHEDFFTRRMVALLAEMRAAFAAWQPAAFCEVDLT